MSKQAEELAEKLTALYQSKNGAESQAAEEVAALIDAELRKERERCADRASAYFDLRLANEPICPTNWKIGLRAVILDDKED